MTLHLSHVVGLFHPPRRPLPQRVVRPAVDWPEWHYDRVDGARWTCDEKDGTVR